MVVLVVCLYQASLWGLPSVRKKSLLQQPVRASFIIPFAHAQISSPFATSGRQKDKVYLSRMGQAICQIMPNLTESVKQHQVSGMEMTVPRMGAGQSRWDGRHFGDCPPTSRDAPRLEAIVLQRDPVLNCIKSQFSPFTYSDGHKRQVGQAASNGTGTIGVGG
ncbi:unnamed protein product [Protopolystoma xenopodis]|uniref:Uncharacterized protein n=1 Tax=Protopolystoma xenopodis TaxID=117903 RepID=A0A3S4ZR18_9PLAT|nr:unnamed protein product [Protopolystoma xenopodis]